MLSMDSRIVDYCLAIPGKSLATRIHRGVGILIPDIIPFDIEAVPHMPILCPPSAVIYPYFAVADDQGEYRDAALIQKEMSSTVTGCTILRES